ncbi:MAG: hypothetical protein H6728_04615 [Myxococcales bacterium]|nr:hypothetical protein [Myxococcales bacterium]MCB9642336.1 hypothetical protein [Myxococcales bacterium]
MASSCQTKYSGSPFSRLFSLCLLCTALLGSGLFSWSCTGSGQCEGDISNFSNDTNGVACTLRCECNNQAYEGYCISGKCISFAREICTQPGAAAPCKLSPQVIPNPTCEWGERICQPPALRGSLWGDCNVYTTVPEEGKDASKAKEQCTNNRDDDCDGKIDDAEEACAAYCKQIGQERPCYEGAPKETINLGACSTGLQRCQADQTWSKCAQQTIPQTEVCDRIDNDCDGKTDEGLKDCPEIRCKEGESIPCYTEAIGCKRDASGNIQCHGACQAGKRVCQNGSYGECQGQTTPQVEDCKDNLDNNCDGRVNEGCLCEDGKTQDCYTGPANTQDIGVCRKGQQTCQGGVWGECRGAQTPTPERCNQLDDDCDGIVDNRCGSCGDGAIRSCVADTPSLQGPCLEGLQVCYNGIWSQCFNQTQPKEEICDGIDNDCNGKIDDNCQSCKPGFSRECRDRFEEPEKAGIGKCHAGIQVCLFDPTEQKYAFGPCLDQVIPETEVCFNSQDDDCDGKTDETDCQICKPGETRACYDQEPAKLGGVGICNMGVQICSFDSSKSKYDFSVCIGARGPNPSGEFGNCDGKDDDCDGKTDEESCGGDDKCISYQPPSEPLQYRCVYKCDPNTPCANPGEICTPQGFCDYCLNNADCSAKAGTSCVGNKCIIP